MRYVRILFLNFQQTFVYRGLSFVWFLGAVTNIGLTVLFWKGATNGRAIIPGWHFSDIFTYYILALVANQLLICHIENHVARDDIHEGNLSAHLLKPFPYVITRFFSEFPWRVTSGFFGIVIFIFFFFVVKTKFILVHTILFLLLAIIMATMGYIISFMFKMILGLFAFWFNEMRGLFETTEVVAIILMGSFMPLALLPQWITTISYFSPFPYIIYFPVIAFEGKLSLLELLFIILKEIVWIFTLSIVYKFLWRNGIKKYSAVGQ